MRLLLISDEEDRYLWDFYRPGCLDGFDIILSAGDLKAEYLSFLVTLSNLPLLYVHGNHDVRYDQAPPEGCECIDDRLVTVKGLRILGLGGCMDYNGGNYQYTEKQMQRRIRRVTRQIRRAGGVDLVLTHAPAAGLGDDTDLAHRGFEAFLPLLDRWHPAVMVHGHVHQSYNGVGFVREREYLGIPVINASTSWEFDLPELQPHREPTRSGLRRMLKNSEF